MFDSVLEKIPGKNDIYYVEHREGTNAFSLRKDQKSRKGRTNDNAWNCR